jgi:hypothetical protein
MPSAAEEHRPAAAVPVPILNRPRPRSEEQFVQEMVIYGVSFDMVGKQPIVLLKTADSNKFLPIWIGHPEAAAILMKLQGATTPRPMTHDLIVDGDELTVLEANAIPGLTDTSLLPLAADAAGIGFDDFVARMLDLAVARTAA